MRKLVMGCAVAGLIAMVPKSEAKLPVSPGALPVVQQGIPKSEIGWASWYGIERQGKPTASGEPFDKDKLTAAHRKLPIGTTVRVTNLKNLESTVLRINDRGPGVEGRIIDVSWEAARKLGFVEAGLTPVEVDVVSNPQNHVGPSTNSGSLKVNSAQD